MTGVAVDPKWLLKFWVVVGQGEFNSVVELGADVKMGSTADTDEVGAGHNVTSSDDCDNAVVVLPVPWVGAVADERDTLLEEGTSVGDESVITPGTVEVGFMAVNNSVEVGGVCGSGLAITVTSVVTSRTVEEP